MDDKERKIIEARYTQKRIAQLERQPISGNFDVVHLKKVHEFIFQDLPKHGITHPSPGLFHDATPEGKDWRKERSLPGVKNGFSVVCYSPMDKGALSRLDQTLAGANPEALRKLKTLAFIERFSRQYAELDYVHPFQDGNSRTLRTFTKQLARESGYAVDWNRFNQNDHTRNLLYIARDRAVGEIAQKEIRSHDNLRDVVYCMDMYGKNPSLRDLLQAAIRPTRALAFEQQPEKQALAAHPELADAYRSLRLAGRLFDAKLPGDGKAQGDAMRNVRQSFQEKLNAGETTNFIEKKAGPKLTPKAVPAKTRKDTEPEPER
jgi:cell filamentation protein